MEQNGNRSGLGRSTPSDLQDANLGLTNSLTGLGIPIKAGLGALGAPQPAGLGIPMRSGLGASSEVSDGVGSPPFTSGLGTLLNIPPARSALTNVFGLPAARTRQSTFLGEIAQRELPARRRDDWNGKFERWEKPASTSEETTLERAQRMVGAAISTSVWLGAMGATVEPQGSYHNNTNTRRDSDADLRVQLPLIKTLFHPNVVVDYAQVVLGLSDSGWTYEQLFTLMRQELETCLVKAFGRSNVIPGSKAYRVKGLTNSRAEVDVVPALRYQNIMWWEWAGRYNTLEGVAILSTRGEWTYNFPDDHYRNGVAKRARTRHQFKRNVRIFKCLRAELTDQKLLHCKVPSFLAESLIYNVEDEYFTDARDDRYGRVRRIAFRLHELVHDAATAATMKEINGLKPLFAPGQAWTLEDARAFAAALVVRFRDA